MQTQNCVRVFLIVTAWLVACVIVLSSSVDCMVLSLFPEWSLFTEDSDAIALPLTLGSLNTKSVAQKEVVSDGQIGAICDLALW